MDLNNIVLGDDHTSPLYTISNNSHSQDKESSFLSTGNDGSSGEDDDYDGSDEEQQELEQASYPTGLEAAERIEGMVLSFLKQLNRSLEQFQPDNPQGRQGNRTRHRKIELQFADRKKGTFDGFTATRSIRYPFKATSKNISSKPFAQVFRVMNFAHEAIVDNMPLTKRDMYYKDVPLFTSQATVDRLVDDLAATFEVDRADLNVRASSKGLICGTGLVINLIGGETIHINHSEGSLIPVSESIESFEVQDNISWVLVVEKEAVFQTLCRLQLGCHASLPGPGIIITGKGYPDVATRQLVKTLSDNLPLYVPILVLVDADAYGLDILSVYKHGSSSLRHERQTLAADRVQWLGIQMTELADLEIDMDNLIPITKYDEKKALSMLNRPITTMPMEWRKELTRMLHIRRKAEIEILSTSSGRYPPGSPVLLHYLLRKITYFVDSSA
ncbi:Spo11/DNA topoisomerase VI subunit A [Hygrophoropsis aurantiaca]|uniref:Spo11/DNA topoisomerase VI subunit A n=1 Tax=Hygrophoropsis aurantiaca TaxID=72124 RepID=A0ACB8AJD2_9AGAM|nr:Spo11/DNA topoisomerase VI subunit A [Hygrophoropsis aurantiaca]